MGINTRRFSLTDMEVDSYHEELDKRTFQVLQKAGTSLAEHYIMATVGHKIRISPEELAKHTQDLVEGDSRGNFSCEEYLEAIESCIRKGWLQVFAPASYEAEVERQRSSSTPELFDAAFNVGDVEFTKPGYLVYRQTILEIFGQRHVEQGDSGCNLNRERCEFQVLASTRGMCQKIINRLKQDPSSYVGKEADIVSVGGMERIGLWKPNPFITLTHGFESKVIYKLR